MSEGELIDLLLGDFADAHAITTLATDIVLRADRPENMEFILKNLTPEEVSLLRELLTKALGDQKQDL